ncbi:putative glutaredoxin domain containing protein [Neospora caninum Liverpool]|uniref:Putative glutaredoxin domain containing protein n=1 Tax=Neospora caninum (strain Liverpool) TaxID=572307 RepID=F0VR06_NEOCL|nr:putative glutaredoxin domain containing protein [Neospora caninum Liverpool]CBZ56153.1 putative glutaredoxin domain containing protein [Neospora caninum Liverpool]|eukprot:XP_003886179.1 putative glutaredoxin domain containing protein [Neospora caninum Liverpool]
MMASAFTPRVSSNLLSCASGGKAFVRGRQVAVQRLGGRQLSHAGPAVCGRRHPAPSLSSFPSVSFSRSLSPFSFFSSGASFSPASARVGKVSSRTFATAQATGSLETTEKDEKDASVATLFQFTVCPYCTATRTVFDFFSLPYEAVEVHPFSKKELLDARLDQNYKKVPIALLDGQQVNDSREIIRRVCELCKYTPRAAEGETAVSGKLSDREQRDIDWAYTHLTPIFPACLYSTLLSSWKAFSSISALSNFSPLERLSVRIGGPLVMFAVTRMKKKKLGITDPAQALESACSEWMQRVQNAGGQSGPFHGGQEPDMADVVVYGLCQALRSAEALQAVRQKNPALDNCAPYGGGRDLWLRVHAGF